MFELKTSDDIGRLAFNKEPLLPAIIQDETTGRVLMLGYMNAEAIEQTLNLGKVTFFSRSKQRLWTKGESSGNFLLCGKILADCDADTLLIKAKPIGPVCHTGTETCFNESLADVNFLSYLQEFIQKRKEQMPEGSYTTTLFTKGINKIAQKVGEEAVETVIEAKDDNMDLFQNEVADLLFHLIVLLAAKDTSLHEVVAVLQKRHG
ncbi:MAG: bifunctional phosphoribosyl-AMP cyclohydrolase/phosphoribosyl-ATP diphosphatase HisIE [Bacteroidota bacterium]